MIIADAFEKQKAKETARRARVVVLGEFSAGKSTLINLLTGGETLRTQVTATQMPAVWMSYGTSAPYRMDLKGNQHPVDLSDPSSISVKDTAYVRMYKKTPALELCDFIDTPGNSDPNIAAAAWERVAEIADVAVWCSPCTQAWRQSELAAWRDVPERVRANSILLLTRADKLTTDADREKVLKRVNREAGDLFSKIHMVSLLEFADTHDFLHDLIAICNGVDTSAGAKSAVAEAVHTLPDDVESKYMESEGSADDGEDTAPTETAQAKTAVADQALEDLIEADPSPVTAAKAPPTQSDPRHGYATALWLEMTADVSADDPDTLNTVFLEFLNQLDFQLQTLNDGAANKAVS